MNRLIPIATMASRLLFLLSLIENVFVLNGSPAVQARTQRTVNFHKGLARIVFGDGSGSILIQSFVLADGQICIKAALGWAGSDATGTHALYPSDDYDWHAAAQKIAQQWEAGIPLPQAAPASENYAEATEPAAATLAAVG